MTSTFTLLALGTVALVAIAALCGCVYVYMKHQSLQEEFLISRNVQLRPSDVYKLIQREPSAIESTLGNVLQATVNGDGSTYDLEEQQEPAQEQTHKAAQEQPAQEQPAQEQPAQEEPAQEQPAQEQPHKPAQEAALSEAGSEAARTDVVSDTESVTEVASKPRRRRVRAAT